MFPTCQDELLERRLVAAAVAYAAVFLDGEVQVALKDSTVTLVWQNMAKSVARSVFHQVQYGPGGCDHLN